jgi:hypothetical protein
MLQSKEAFRQVILPPPTQRTLHSFLSLPTAAASSHLENADTWGHVMDGIDMLKTFRIVLQNPNGISSDHSNVEFQYGLAQCRHLGIGVISLAETKLIWMGSVNYYTNRWFHQTWDFSAISFSQVNEIFFSTFQPGGTLTSIVDHWTSRLHSKRQDPYGLGRWSYAMLRGKHNSLITIITAYRVSQKSSYSIGVKTAYMQQVRALKSNTLQHTSSITHAEPNKQFILDLQAWIQYLKSQGHQIILNLDNNDNFYATEGFVHPLHYQNGMHVTDKSHYGSL